MRRLNLAMWKERFPEVSRLCPKGHSPGGGSPGRPGAGWNTAEDVVSGRKNIMEAKRPAGKGAGSPQADELWPHILRSPASPAAHLGDTDITSLPLELSAEKRNSSVAPE